MPAFGKLQLVARVSEDFQETKRNLSTDPPDQFFVDDAFLTGAAVSKLVTVANGAVDTAQDIGGLTAIKFLYLTADGPITVRLVAAGTLIPVGASAQAGTLVLLGSGAGMNALLISNSSGAARKVRYAVAGA